MHHKLLALNRFNRHSGHHIHIVRSSKSRKPPRQIDLFEASPFDSIPDELKATPNFLLYKLLDPQVEGGKKRKVPVDSRTGRPLANWQDPSQWMSFEEASAKYRSNPRRFSGLGYAMSGNGIICVDIDKARDAAGRYTEFAQELVKSIPGWVEVSTSGNLHIWTRGDWPEGKTTCHDLGIEIFNSTGFVALTGIAYEVGREIPAVDIDPQLLAPYARQRPPKKPLDPFERYCERDPHLTLEEAKRIVLEELAPTPAREDWLRIGMALHHQFDGDHAGLELWDEFSQRDGCGNYQGFEDVKHQWDSFKPNHANPVTFASLRHQLRREPTEDSILLENPFVELDVTEHRATRYLLNGLIGEGIALFNGASNAGKTTLMLDLVGCVTHLCPEDHFLRVKGRRKVIYLTEDIGQIERIFRGKRFFGGLIASPQEINEWVKVISTKKFSQTELIKLVTAITKQESVLTTTKSGTRPLPPLFVMDTASASFAIEDENSNSEVSNFIAALKDAIAISGAPVWIVAHTPKASAGVDVSDLAARGAGAWGANVQTVVGIEREKTGNRTTLAVGKNRIQTKFNELEFTTRLHEALVEDEYGDMQAISYITGELKASSTVERLARKEREQREKAAADQEHRKNEIADLVMAHVRDFPYQNRQSLRDAIKGNNQTRDAVIDQLIDAGYLRESATTPEERKASDGRRVLLRLTDKRYPSHGSGV